MPSSGILAPVRTDCPKSGEWPRRSGVPTKPAFERSRGTASTAGAGASWSACRVSCRFRPLRPFVTPRILPARGPRREGWTRTQAGTLRKDWGLGRAWGGAIPPGSMGIGPEIRRSNDRRLPSVTPPASRPGTESVPASPLLRGGLPLPHPRSRTDENGLTTAFPVVSSRVHHLPVDAEGFALIP